MADIVISYKRSKETLKNQNRWFRYINWAPDRRNHQKSLKKIDHSIAICSLTSFYSFDMFWMGPVESSCPGGSEFCVIKGGRRCFRISNGRPKFTLFKNNKKPICCVQIKCKSRNFRNWACPHKSLLPKDYGKKWFTWASSILNYFEQPKHGQKMLYPQSPIHIDFLNPEGVRIPWVLAPKNFSVENCWWRSNLRKVPFFNDFLVRIPPPPKKKKEEKKRIRLMYRPST